MELVLGRCETQEIGLREALIKGLQGTQIWRKHGPAGSCLWPWGR